MKTMKINRETLIDTVKSGANPTKFGMTKREIARVLGVTGDERRDLRLALGELMADGTFVRDERKAYRMSDALPNVMVLDIDHIDDQGDVIAVPAKWDKDEDKPQIIIKQKSGRKNRGHRNANQVSVGDRALCRLKTTEDGIIATVIKKLGDGPRAEVGFVVKGGRGLRIRPAKKGSRFDYIPERGAKINDLDIVEFELSGKRNKGERIARIIKIIGNAKHGKAASLISLLEHNISTGFSDKELEDAKALTLPKIDKYRKDLRDLPLVTIDPVDAKDFDDAIFAKPDDSAKNRGGHIVWVAIADVSAFVAPGSALDKGAFKRGNSVYLPDRVEPMLPEEISADLCSLRPHEDRACLVVKMRFDRNGDKISHTFTRGLMRSHARLTYAQAQEAFDGAPGEAAKPVADILKDIYTAYEAVRTARSRRAPLEIEMPERKVVLDAKGRVTGIEVKDRFDAHKLVEEFMIQANVCAAQALERADTPLIFRVHEPPEMERVQGLADFLPALDLKWSMGQRPTPKRFNRLIEQARGRDLVETVSMSILRTQMKAYYTPLNKGHFGLSLTHYAHFTSPIRRYADLVVHRALVKAFNLGEGGTSAEELTRLKEISEHISTTERSAMAAERDAKDRYIAAFLADKIGATFKGRITGVTNAGLFIGLDETGADGFVPARTIGFERFIFGEKTKSLIGADTGGTYHFGRRVEVKLTEAKPLQGGLLFEILTKPEKGTLPKHLAKRRQGQGGGYKGGGKGRKHQRRRR
ncbi:MAG: ribonuclease R [Robiginitomaculum sp.]|nr:ribonuclease R [Robiginitomaculum sp.]